MDNDNVSRAAFAPEKLIGEHRWYAIKVCIFLHDVDIYK